MKTVKITALTMLLAALLLTAALAGAQGPATLSQVTVTFVGGLQAPFATANAPEGFGGGPSPVYRDPGGAIQMPGIAKCGNVTLAQGSFANNNQFWQWYHQIQMNTIARGTVVVSGNLAGNPVNWVLNNAWPSKVNGVVQQGGSVQVDSLEITYENVVVQQQ